MPHRQTGYLNYLSNSNLDYNNAMNMRRYGAYSGIALQNPSLAGLVVDNMGGIVETAQEQIMEKPLLWTGIALLSYPHAKKLYTKKSVSKKNEKNLMIAGVGAIVAHFVMPMLKGE